MIIGGLLLLLLLWLVATRSGRQAWSVTLVAILTIPQRLGSSLVVVVGIAGVVGSTCHGRGLRLDAQADRP